MTFALLKSQDAILTTPELKILYLVVRTWELGFEYVYNSYFSICVRMTSK